MRILFKPTTVLALFAVFSMFTQLDSGAISSIKNEVAQHLSGEQMTELKNALGVIANAEEFKKIPNISGFTSQKPYYHTGQSRPVGVYPHYSGGTVSADNSYGSSKHFANFYSGGDGWDPQSFYK